MASAQLMEEELQRSVLVSDQAGVGLGSQDGDDAEAATPNGAHASGEDADMKPEDTDEGDEGDEEDDKDAIVDSVESESASDEDDDEDGNDEEDDDEEDEEDGPSDAESLRKDSSDGAFDEEDADDVDGEDDVDPSAARSSAVRGARPRMDEDEEDEDEDDNDDDHDDDGEGVGAVKIRPGETDDEDSSSSDPSDLSDGQSQSDEESEGEAPWEETAENGDEEDEDEDNAQSNSCMFCKQDEDHDPSEEFEAFLACRGCGDHAHQQCARENDALSGNRALESWRCPDCDTPEPRRAKNGDGDDDEDEEGVPVNETSSPVNPESPSTTTRGATAPKLARDLLPSQRGTIKPDSHSVFNHLVLDDDPMDGSRVLRKRKTSSAEADENIVSLRKRRRNTDDQSHDEANGAAEESTRPHSVRSLRLKTAEKSAPATIERKTRTSLLIKCRVNAAELRRILSRPPKGPKRGGGGRAVTSRVARRPRTSRGAAPTSGPALAAPFSSSTFYQPFFFDKEMEELKGKPYGGILSEAEADTSKTFPQPEDRKRFDEAKQTAEEKWRERILKMQTEVEVPVKKSKKAAGPASQIECIEFGGWEIDTWYAAPYPEEYSRNRVLYICEFCLKYMNSDYVAWRHKLKCPAKHPPGDEIYRNGSVSVFEVDGRKNPVYCQNLCLLAKLFLGSKTLYYDVEPFLFYVLCEFDEFGYHFVGYFSKEKRASSQNNVSCILTLPIHQRKGYGNLLIDFSYLLTRVEKKTGSPEKPLSDMGLVSYRNYWRLVLCQYMVEHFSDDKATPPRGLSIKQISDDTGLTADDVISALEGLRCLVRDPQSELYAFRVDLEFCKDYAGKWEAKKYVKLDPKFLTWTPYVMGRSNATNFELGPALNAIAPRDDEEETKPTDLADPTVAPVLTNGESSVVFAATAATAATATNPVPTSNGVLGHDDAKVDVDSTVLESTEPNENAEKPEAEAAVPAKGKHSVSDAVDADSAATAADVKAPTAPGDAAAPQEHSPSLPAAPTGPLTAPKAKEPEEQNWSAAYKGIPITRFQVFPAISTRRVDRPRPVIRAPIAQPIITPRPKPRRSTGGTSAPRRSTTSKPKASSSSTRVRKSGGTGRGPGRWPKGTKKSDYGNADSGPGLPPAWVAARIAAEADAKKSREEAARAARAAVKNGTSGAASGGGGGGDAQDTVRVHTPNAKEFKGGKGGAKDEAGDTSAVKSSAKKNGVNGH